MQEAVEGTFILWANRVPLHIFLCEFTLGVLESDQQTVSYYWFGRVIKAF